MNRLVAMIGVVFVLSLGFAGSSQAKSMGQSGLMIYDSSNLVGLRVKSLDGVELGRISDLVVDSQGHVDFAVVRLPEFGESPVMLVAVPFSLLKISEGRSQQIHVVLNAAEETFYEAPRYKNLADPQQAASLDRYFGVRPYWREKTGIIAQDWIW